MEGVLELAGAYECSCRHDGYPILPQVAACGEFVEHTALFRLVQQILPEDIRRRQIYKVPIVCPVPAFKIEAGYLAAASRSPAALCAVLGEPPTFLRQAEGIRQGAPRGIHWKVAY